VASFLSAVVMVGGPMSVAYVYADSNTIGGPTGGEGSGAVTGFVAGNVHYEQVPGNPSVIQGVSFSLDVEPPAGSSLEASLDGGLTWSACSVSATDVDCPVPATSLATIEDLRVVAAQ
jgi:hypothetical protein